MKLYTYILLLLLFSSCKKDRISLLVTELNTPTTADIHDISFSDSENGYAVGGTRWEHGEVLTTSDGGQSWLADTIANNELNAVCHSPTGANIVGFNGYFFQKTADWDFRQLEKGENLQSVVFYDENLGVAVGGIAFHTGIIYRFNNSSGITDTLFYPIEHEMSDVAFLDQNTVIAVGYGIVLRSTDAGKSWSPRPIDGDFFKAVHFPTPKIGYAVGFSGTIIKTTDGGDSWDRIRNSNRLVTSRKDMADVFFTSPDVGYIVGEDGLFWKTEDGGDSWIIIEMPETNLNSITIVNETGFIGAEEGNIFKFVN